ncbi:MAG: EamA family transporter [Elusimicrobia bacterium]|nr:EamA family transporter [Elusimicrobiota bacterium]
MVKARVLVVMLVAIAAAGAGNVALSKGMQAVGSLEAFDPVSLWAFFTAAVANPWVIGGILLELANYLLWLAVLSWSEVSWALPLNALEYILVALTAAVFLGERVGPVRWAGIVLIAAGVALLYGSWHNRETPSVS